MSDKESLNKQDTLDNVKSESGDNLVVNSIPKIDSGASSESTSDSTSDFKSKTEKTKSKNENDKVLKKTLDQTKKEKNSLNIKVKDDLDKSKEKSKIEKDKINDESDDSKEKKRRLKSKNGNPFLRIIGEMTDEDKQFENDNNSNLTKHLSQRKQNLKTLSSGEKMKLKLCNESKKCGRNLNSTSDSKKEPRPLPPPAPKLKLPESKTILEKKNYSINIEKKEFVGEKKPTVKTFKSKFRSTGLEEQPPPPPSKSKVQSKKSTKNLTPLSLSKAEKRSLSPPSSDTPVEKKPKNSPTDTKKPRKILNLCTVINILNQQNYYSVSANYKFLTLDYYKTELY